MSPLLLLFLIPLASSVLLFLKPSRLLALMTSLIPLFMLISQPSQWLGCSYNISWIPSLGIHFQLSIDSLSLLFLYLVNAIVPICILIAPNYGLILLLQGLLIGFFTSQDLVCFTFFFEAILLPLYFIVRIWGGEKRKRAALLFITYMLAGSVLMVAALLSLYVSYASFDLKALIGTIDETPVVCAIFLAAFLIKTPLFPFHAWLPDTYCQAPTSGTILLSALLSKAGIYGILRVSMPLFPTLMTLWSPYLLCFAIAGVLYGAFAAYGQTDYKRLIAYSSLSHVNFVLAGLFVSDQMAHSGAILQAINHAITATGLFLVAGWLEKRLNSTSIGSTSGLALSTTRLCWLSLFFVLSAVALPGLNTFVSELLLLYGVFQSNMWLAALLGSTVILSVMYMLRWMHSLYFGICQSKSPDINSYDLAIAAPLVIAILWLGMYPHQALKYVEVAAQTIRG